jgi:hypothetical protein
MARAGADDNCGAGIAGNQIATIRESIVMKNDIMKK